MKGWLPSLVLFAVIAAGAVGLWATWSTTQPSRSPTIGPVADLASRTTSTTSPTATTLPTPPPCDRGNEPVAGDPVDDWATIVVDPVHRLPENFTPPDLVSVSEAGFDTPDQVRRIVIDDLAALRVAAEEAGTPVAVVSGYRSQEYQTALYERKVAAHGVEATERRTAPPGHSEHQLGTTVDVLEPGSDALVPAFAETPAGRWLADNAHRFGFVQTYPADSIDVTCYEFEPWHLRYVGRDVAAQIVESGLTPREWMFAHGSGGASEPEGNDPAETHPETPEPPDGAPASTTGPDTGVG